jgi:hypothetical protein
VLGCYDRLRALLRRIGTEGRFRAPRGARAALPRARRPVERAAPPAAAAEARARPRGPALRAALARRAAAPPAWGARGARGRTGGGDARAVARAPRAARRAAPLPLGSAVPRGHERAPDEVSARLFLATLVRALSKGASGAAIWFPSCGWSEVLGAPAQAQLEREGVTVRLGARVVALARGPRRLRALELAGAPTIPLEPQTSSCPRCRGTSSRGSWERRWRRLSRACAAPRSRPCTSRGSRSRTRGRSCASSTARRSTSCAAGRVPAPTGSRCSRAASSRAPRATARPSVRPARRSRATTRAPTRPPAARA